MTAAATARTAAADRRNQIIVDHLPLVRAIAKRVRQSLPVQVETDDLVQAGTLGLFDAVDKYDETKQVAFELYAKHRIRGAILDSLRQLDSASRDLRKRFKAIEQAAQQQAQELGRAPEEAEVAGALGLSADELQRRKVELQAAGLQAADPHRVEDPETPFSEPTAAAERQPDREYARGELRQVLTQAMRSLSPRYQQVIALYYHQDQTMKQIGDALGVNESRVSQIHKAALAKLNAALRASGFENAEAVFEASARG